MSATELLLADLHGQWRVPVEWVYEFADFHGAPAPGDNLRDLRAELLDVMARMNEAAAGLPLAMATDDEVGEALLDLAKAQRQMDAAISDVAGRFSGGNVWPAEGCRSARDWLRRHTNASSGDAGPPFDSAIWMRRYPAMAQAWREAAISRRHMRALDHMHKTFPRLSAALTQIEAELAEGAKDLDPAAFGNTLLRTLQRIDPDAIDEAEAKRRRDSYGFRASTLPDGSVIVDGTLPAEIGAQLIAALGSARDAIRNREAAELAAKLAACGCEDAGWCKHAEGIMAEQPLPDASLPSDTKPSLASRNVEALALILDAAATATGDARLPDTGGERPVVHITIDSQSLIDHGSAAPGWIQSLTGTQITPITATAAQRLSCDAVAQLLVLNPAGDLDAISAKWRITPPQMRRAILTRDHGKCRFPGCHTQIREVHHVIHWAKGGKTTSDNLVGLCSHHHHLAHEGGWSLSGDPNRTLRFTNPAGRFWDSDPPLRD
ncbi:unannotated protein [freshwater metagenome]|uniref:Unannotated protein n=1 Tax=freshwater metagenome TaxID=449393 RepID=A0A6J7H0X3_9ZZZZ|nr:DUF222 domain-containing protein [Actinomycetota bacterium]